MHDLFFRFRTLPKWYRHLQTRRRSIAVLPQVGTSLMPIKMEFLRFRNRGQRRRLRHHRRPSRRKAIQPFIAMGHTLETAEQDQYSNSTLQQDQREVIVPTLGTIPVEQDENKFIIDANIPKNDSSSCGLEMICVHKIPS